MLLPAEKAAQEKRRCQPTWPAILRESRLEIGQEQAEPLISRTIEYVEKKFPEQILKIFDSPPGASCPVIEAEKEADYVILVTEPTPFGLHDLKLAEETMNELNKKYGVVINRHGIGNDELLDYCKQQEIPVIARIPDSRKIAEFYSRGELIYEQVDDFREQRLRIDKYIRQATGGGSMKEIVVISGKGGTGKTSITASLACLGGADVIVADCDVKAADMHLLLRLNFS